MKITLKSLDIKEAEMKKAINRIKKAKKSGDHGIVAGRKIDEVRKLGVDMIIADHHQAGKVRPTPLALIYTTKISGSALAWFFAREIVNRFKIPNTKYQIRDRLELAAIGTVADQLPLIGSSRSIVKYGLTILNH